ncbi:MAG: autotransporter domain-containing protein [Novosphingobium sp.]|uniref:autotransporter outer membrane beta-barrel domain-containing protein n=1 Tax=Novosphingobium sp. TaxID=1874826 RepID=UPI0012CB6FAC|nr:autotransporter outer membrane beta-barrel domain-containing protein [Novosphingobium sp.]MPS68650.1 autotransporter domain-containing protein [Novosphingobium sp.]
MPRYLLASTALLALATAAHAEDVTTKKTTPLLTSTIKNGAADAINITKDGSVVLTSGTAVTMDSNNNVANAGAITIANSNGARGIVANAGTTGDIVNTGTITLDEPYAPTDDDKDGDLDGPFALGSNRIGIRTEGDHTGKITQSGTIVVEGNDSAGVSLGGKLTGNFTHDGKTSVLGDNAVGVKAGQIDGNVRLAGTVQAQGKNAVGAHFGGDINGAMVVQGSIVSTGYRYPTPPSDPSKLDADDLLQGGSAVIVEGNVTGGIVLAVPPKDNDANNADEDADGIPDATEGSAKVVTYGKAPAMVIGSATNDIAIGPVAGTASKYGLQIEGGIEGNGLYAGIDGNGLAIGGLGGDVTIANGIGVSGTVVATSKDANATAIRLGAGASTPLLQNSGTIGAAGGNTTGAQTTAIRIDAGASLPTIRNSGTIKAVAAGENGSATAISDASGTLNLVENSGTISATGAKAGSGRNIAIDLSNASGSVTVKQTQVGAGFTAPSIVGDVLLGGGNDTVDIADGTVTGNVLFGAGNNTLALSGDAVQTGNVTFGGGTDTMTLAGTSRFVGTADFGGGADSLTLTGTSVFSGSLVNSGNLAVKITGGTLDVNKPATIGSLDVSKDGVLAVTLNKAAGQGSAYTVAGTASFEDGAKLSIKLADVSTAEGSYQVLTAGTILGRDNLEASTDLVPFMFKATLDEDAAANTVVVDIARRTVAELGLNRSQATAYNAIFTALSQDEKIEDVFLGITNGDQFRQTVGQMLPDHAGGSFEGISLGTRTLARQLMEPTNPVWGEGRFSTTMNLSFWGSDKKAGSSAAYNLQGYAMSFGAEYLTGIGRFGGTFSYLWNRHTSGGTSEIKSNSFELAGHWRGQFGAVQGFGRASIGRSNYDSERQFIGAIGTEKVNRTIKGKWDGTFVTAAGGASYEGGGSHFFYRPAVSVDYVRLKEDGYTENGGGKALDLTVASRTSDELGVNGGVTLGVDFMGMERRDENWFRIETEGGWREIVSGGIGSTTAHFAGGQNFTLDGDEATSGWFARLRAIGGTLGLTMGGELAAEDRHGRVDLALRGSVTIGW